MTRPSEANRPLSAPMLRRLGRLISLWGPPVAIMAIIFWLSGRPAGEIKPVSDALSGWLDGWLRRVPWLPAIEWLKVGHVIGYGLLGICLYRAMWRVSRYPLAASLLIVLAYAISDELHQQFVPGRSGSWQDVLLDVAAAALFIALTQRWLERASRAAPPD